MIYLDSCIIIYAIEGEPELRALIRERLASAPGSNFVISPLVELECLVKPLREQDFELGDRYRKFLAMHRNVEPGREAYLRAAELRAHHSLKAIDALHLAMAQLAGCEALWTNDDRLARATDIAVDVLRAS